MKVVTWNCNGALRNKFQHLSDINADIYIIQECETPEQTNHKYYMDWSRNHLWIGSNKNKEIGIFAAEHIINNNFQILGVWTHQNNSPNFGYIGQLWKYLQVNKQNLQKIIIAGDFNSNSMWDEWDRRWNHSDVVRDLKEVEIMSLYHKHFKEEQGKESKPTFFLHRRLEKPFHIDYIFGSSEFSNALTKMNIGNTEYWLKISDHLPMICEFEAEDLK